MSLTKTFFWNEICKMQEDSIEQEMAWIDQQNIDHQVTEFEAMEKAIQASNMPAFLSLNR